MNESESVDAPTISSDLRTDHLRRRTLRSSSSEDVIVIESPNQAETSRALRRRTPSPESNTSIVDLTCFPDEVVDLTSPDIGRVEPPPQEISDEEADGLSSTVKSSPKESQPSLNCPVCLESFPKIVKVGGHIMSTICGHVFCNVCIYTALNHSKKCPTCRKKLDIRKIHKIHLPM